MKINLFELDSLQPKLSDDTLRSLQQQLKTSPHLYRTDNMKAIFSALALASLTAFVNGAAQVTIWSEPNCQGTSQKLPNGLYCETYNGKSAQSLSSDNGIHYECQQADTVGDCDGSSGGGKNPTTNPHLHDMGNGCTNAPDGATTITISCQDDNPLKR
jgi:hypothetical protein